MKNKRTTTFSTYCGLAVLLKQIKEAGYSDEELSKFTFELDCDGCYYEGDTPCIVCKYDGRL